MEIGSHFWASTPECVHLHRPREDVEDGYWELNLGPLEEQQVLLTAEICLLLHKLRNLTPQLETVHLTKMKISNKNEQLWIYHQKCMEGK